MMIAKPDQTISELASGFGEAALDIRVKGIPGLAVEERSSQDGHFIATHVLWTIGSHVAWFTAYEIRRSDAAALAEGFDIVTEAEWRAAADQAS